MNIRKKILFNPTYLKSHKPDTRDDTTAHTKNSALLQKSKTIIETQKTFQQSKNILIHQLTNKNISRKDKKYIRTISKDNFRSARKNLVGVIASNQQDNLFSDLRSTQQTRTKSNMQEEINKLPLLANNVKTRQFVSSQYQKERNPFYNYPSSIHIQNIQTTCNIINNLKKTENVLNMNTEEIERRKQKFNSMNMDSFYFNHQKSIVNMNSLSKLSSKHNYAEEFCKQTSTKNINQTLNILQQDKKVKFYDSKNRMNNFEQIDHLQQRNIVEKFLSSQINQVHQNESKHDLNESKNKPFLNDSQCLQQSIHEEIQIENQKNKFQLKKLKNQQSSCEKWSETCKSQEYINKENNKQKNKLQSSGSILYESEEITSNQVLKLYNKEKNPQSRNLQSPKIMKNDEQVQNQKFQESSQLCQSYFIP